MPPRSKLKQQTYGVFADGARIMLQAGNSALPMPWDIAIHIGAKLRVYLRDAQEYMGQSRQLTEPDAEKTFTDTLRTVTRESKMLVRGDYEVYAEGPDVVLEAWGGKLTMTPKVARDISGWLTDAGWKIRDLYYPDMLYRPAIANLTDLVAHERQVQTRRDATSTFS